MTKHKTYTEIIDGKEVTITRIPYNGPYPNKHLVNGGAIRTRATAISYERLLRDRKKNKKKG